MVFIIFPTINHGILLTVGFTFQFQTKYGTPDLLTGCDTLDRTTSEHCIMITSLRGLTSLEKLLDLPPSEITTEAFGTLPLSNLVDNLVAKAREKLFDEKLGVFISGADQQVSWASNDWAILAGLHRTKHEGAEIMKRVYFNGNAARAVTPYLHHYVSSFPLYHRRYGANNFHISLYLPSSK